MRPPTLPEAGNHNNKAVPVPVPVNIQGSDEGSTRERQRQDVRDTDTIKGTESASGDRDATLGNRYVFVGVWVGVFVIAIVFALPVRA